MLPQYRITSLIQYSTEYILVLQSTGMWVTYPFQARLCMFPEGTRNGSATLLPFKKGAFHVAIASQTPIQPIVVSRYNFLDDHQKLFNSGMYTNFVVQEL